MLPMFTVYIKLIKCFKQDCLATCNGYVWKQNQQEPPTQEHVCVNIVMCKYTIERIASLNWVIGVQYVRFTSQQMYKVYPCLGA